MRAVIGTVLLLAGAGVILYGLGNALLALASLYQGAVNDPLNQPANAEAGASARMTHFALVGAVGIIPMVVGSVLLKLSFFQRLSRRAGRR